MTSRGLSKCDVNIHTRAVSGQVSSPTRFTKTHKSSLANLKSAHTDGAMCKCKSYETMHALFVLLHLCIYLPAQNLKVEFRVSLKAGKTKCKYK